MPRKKKAAVEENVSIPAGSAETSEQPQVSKAQAVRNYLQEHPDAMPKAVADALQAQGFDVSSAFVSNVKFQMGKKKVGRRKAPAAATTSQPPADNGDQISLAALLEAKKLVQKLGSADAAKRAITAFAQLSR